MRLTHAHDNRRLAAAGREVVGVGGTDDIERVNETTANPFTLEIEGFA
jgi:hypothetical protein